MLDTKLIQTFDAKRDAIVASFKEKRPTSYGDIIQRCVAAIGEDHEYDCPDASRMTSINHGSYQGTLVFVFGGKGYQPDDHYLTKVGYGSCSHCDTFEAIESRSYMYGDDDECEGVEADAAQSYFTLGLHMIQRMVAL